MDQKFWDERYASSEYVYGEAPNAFLKQQLDLLSPGTILFPAEGEGRNAVYAAKAGWKVSAFDQSAAGQKKALELAARNSTSIDYLVNAFENLPYRSEQFDVLALIFAHFPAQYKSAFHKALIPFLKKGGRVIFEAYSKKQLAYQTVNERAGGPKNIDMLFSVEEITSDFAGFETVVLREEEVNLHEGLFHQGKGSTVRFVGIKK